MNSVKEYIAPLLVRSRESLAIMKKELSSYFISPIAYIVITVFLVLIGVLFFMDFFLVKQAQMRRFFELMPPILSLVIPAVTMRLFSEERHSGSLEILMTLPVTTLDAVIGKVLAALAFVLLMIAPTLVYAVTVFILGTPDYGPIIGGYLGTIFLAGAYASIGGLMSSLSRNQIVAFIAALALCFFLWLVNQLVIFLPAWLRPLQYLGTGYHFDNIARGIINSRDIIYFLSVMALSIMMTVKILDERR